MKIFACIKQVIDTDGPLQIDRNTKSIDTRNVPWVVNPYDEIAVEEALQAKEACGKGQVTVVSLGDNSAEKGLRHCLAMGADRAILVCDTAFNGSDGYITGVILAKAISLNDYDLVLCGVRAVDTNAGQVGAVVATELGIPYVSSVAKIEVSLDGKAVRAYRRLERGDREVVEVELPALLAIELGHKPRYPSFPRRVSAQKASIERYGAAKLGLLPAEVGAAGAKTTITAVTPPKPKAGKLFAPPSNLSPAERMRLLMTGGIQEKKGDTLEGNPKDIAAKLVDFLKSQGFLPEEETKQ